MNGVLLGTAAGCWHIAENGVRTLELEGRAVNALTVEPEGSCLAVADGAQVLRRSTTGAWMVLAQSELVLVSLARVGDRILAGSMGDGALCHLEESKLIPVRSFATVPGHETWFGEGPPLHVRSISATAGGAALFAAVHVGGIPRSVDGGETWQPTIPIDWDVHEVSAHRSEPLVAAATAVGLAVSRDAGETWNLFQEGPAVVDSLAVATLETEVLFSVQDGPFAARSQVWRWKIGSATLEQVRDGLPEWLSGKVDTQHIHSNHGRALIVDRGGTLWLSRSGSSGWQALATELDPVFSVQML